MRARHRHFKATSVGATLGLDARFISGLSNASAISQWDDRSSSSNNATQSTSANQPTYRTAVSGGSPTVQFTPSASDWANGQYLLLASNIAFSEMTLFSFYRQIDSRMAVLGGNGQSYTNGGEFWGSGNAVQLLWRATNDAGTTISFSMGNSFVINASTRDSSGNTNIRINGISRGTGTVSETNSSFKAVGARRNFGPGRGDIGCVFVVPSLLSDPLIKKITHSIAISFKHACS